MSHRTKILQGVTLLAAALCAAQTYAQQEDEKPKPAGRPYLPLPSATGDQGEASDNQGMTNLQPDSGPITGVQNPTLGTLEMRHSYWIPGIQFASTARSSPLNSTGSTGWSATNYAGGNLSLLQGWGHSHFSTNYTGGGSFSTESNQDNVQFHQLALAYEIDGRRSQFLLMDQFSYLPESSFGFGAGTGLSVPGVGGALGAPVSSLQGGFLPNQSDVAVGGTRYSNSSAAQLTFQLSARGSITVSGVYGVLRFVDTAGLESDSPSYSMGYNYAVSRNDSIGILYRFTTYHFLGQPQAIVDHAAQMVYGRRLTGRLALQLAGGPEITTFRVPIGGVTQRVSGSGSASLTYAFRRSNVSLNYTHGVSGGGGAFVGATTDQVGSSASRSLSRVWQGNVNFSYARNGAVANSTGAPTPPSISWYAGAGLARPLSHTTNFSLGYQAQVRDSLATACTGPGCNGKDTVHLITLSLQWSTRPLVIR